MIELDFDLMPRFIYANSEVRADNGKVALQLGPVVYCLEEVDNGKNLSAIYLDTSKPVSAYHDESLGEDVKAIKMMGKRRKKTQWMTKELYEEEKPIFEDIEITAVPYGIWGNRTPGEMLVWVNHTIV